MPDIKIIHNVSVDLVSSAQEISPLLVSQLYSPVRWVETCNFISSLDLPIVECGPGKVLSGLFKANKLENYFSSSDEEFYEKLFQSFHLLKEKLKFQAHHLLHHRPN